MTRVKTHPGADCDNDHIVFMGKIRIDLKKLRRSKMKPKIKWKVLIEDTNVNAKFCQQVEERYKQCEEDSNKWKTLQKALVNSAQECIPKCGMTAKKKWMTVEILEQVEVRRRVERDMDEYRRVNLNIRNVCRAAKKEYLNQQCEEIEELKNKNIQIMYERVKAVVNKKRWYISRCVKDEDGNVLVEQDQIKRRWTGYINGLYSDTERKDRPGIQKQMTRNPIRGDEIREQ